MERIIGSLIAAAAVRIAGAALALYIGMEAYAFVSEVFGATSAIQAAL